MAWLSSQELELLVSTITKVTIEVSFFKKKKKPIDWNQWTLSLKGMASKHFEVCWVVHLPSSSSTIIAAHSMP